MCFRCFIIISPCRSRGHSFEQTRTPFIQGYFVPSLVEINQVLVVLEKTMKLEKVYKRTNGRTNRRIDGRTDE